MVSYEFLARTRTFGQRHHLSVSGDGIETLVLANGFGTNQSAWHRILPRLEERFRVVRFDWSLDQDHYDSSRYATLKGYAEDLLAIILATDAAPCRYLGHSMAGMIGVLAAKMRPDYFRQMVMLAPSPCYIDKPGYSGGFKAEEVDALLRQMGEDYVAWAKSFSPLAVAGRPDQEEVAEFTRSLLAMRPDEAYSMALTVFRLDMRNQLDGFGIPTTIVQSRNDIAVPIAVAEYLHARWPQSGLEIIEASGHFPHLTAPDALSEILERAL